MDPDGLGLTTQDCTVLVEHERLRVLGPPADAMFVMKLNAGRAPDVDDAMSLWPLTSFTDAA